MIFFLVPFTLIGLPFSLISLVFSSLQIFSSQRLGSYSQIKFTQFCFLFPFMLMQTTGLLLSWAIISAYLGVYVILIIGLSVVIQYVVLETFVFGWSEQVKAYDAVLCGVPEKKRYETVQKIYFTALATSWIAPVTVWSHNKPSKVIKQRRGLTDKTKYFSIVSGATTNAFLIFVLANIGLFNLNGLNLLTGNNAPITHCFQRENATKSSNYIFLVNEVEFRERQYLISVSTQG